MAKKNNKYAPKTRSEVRKAATVNLPEGVDPREATLRGIFDDAREYANWWYDERAVQDKYKSQLPPEQLQAMKDRLASATFDTSKYGDKIRKSPHAFRAGATDAEINRELMRPTLGGIAAPEDNIFWVKRPTDGNVSHEGIGHIAGDQNYNILKAVPYIGTGDNLAGEEYNRYVTQPNERNAQLWDFRYENRNLKDDSGNYFIDPERQLTPDDIETMRSKGARFPGQWKNNTNEDIVKLHNAVADIGGVDNPFDVNMAAYGGRLYGIGGLLGGLASSAKGLVSGSQNGILGGIASGVSNAISGGMSTGVGGAMQTIGGIASNIPGIGGIIGAGVNVLGGLVNRAFGSRINKQFVADTEENINNQLGAKIDDSSFDSVLEQQATNRGMDGLVKSQVGKDGWFSNKAKRITKDLNRKIANANNALRMNFANAVNNVTENQNLDALANYSAYGGGIHIKKANRGKFTEYCGGKVTSECISRGKRSSSPAVRKRATFAANARKWHDDGGPLEEYDWDSLYWDSKPALPKILDSEYISDRWEAENHRREGWVSPDNSYTPHPSAEGGRKTVGPGIKLGVHEGFKEDRRYSEKELNDKVVQLSRNIESDLNKSLGTDTVSPQIMRGLVDLAYQVKGNNLTRSYPNLLKEVKKGDIKGIRREAKVTWKDEKGNRREDTRRNKYREDNYWYYADGGFLGTHGAGFSNGVTIIGNGGTHEQNPFEGVQMGVDPQGIPNLVEEGEVVYNDYVFSNRTKLPKRVKKSLKLRGETFADGAKQVQKSSEERPNDPISRRTVEIGMARLAQAQESIRQRKARGNKFADGGKKYRDIEVPMAGINTDYSGQLPTKLNRPAGVAPIEEQVPDSELEPTWMRYAPVVGSAMGVMGDLFGITNTPDYGPAESLNDAIHTPKPIGARTLGNYLIYRLLDTNYMTNKLDANTAAQRRALLNTSGGNRATAAANLIAANYNYGNQMGDLFRQAQEYNQQQRERVEGFNRQTNQYNADAQMKADLANAQAKQQTNELRLKQRMTQAQMRDTANVRSSSARSANLTNLFDNLGAIGQENFSRNMITSNPALYYSLDNKGSVKYKKNNKKKRGGRITYGW